MVSPTSTVQCADKTCTTYDSCRPHPRFLLWIRARFQESLHGFELSLARRGEEGRLRGARLLLHVGSRGDELLHHRRVAADARHDQRGASSGFHVDGGAALQERGDAIPVAERDGGSQRGVARARGAVRVSSRA